MRGGAAGGGAAVRDGLAGAGDDGGDEACGQRGVRVDGVLHPAAPAPAAVATGAGDALAAGSLAGGISLGLAAAARAVSKMGAMP